MESLIKLTDKKVKQDQLVPTSTSPKLMNICFLIENGHVLLGYKKRGFGMGRWNGFGGKVQPNETIEQGTIREMKEEAGVDVSNLENRGKITFKYPDKPQPFEVHLFVAKSHKGELVESEEMRPAWFNVLQVPLKSMWVDDEHWLPQLLAGKSVEGTIYFADENTIIDKKLKFY